MPPANLLHVAQTYADLLNQVGDAALDEAVRDVCWDERTNLFSLAAGFDTDQALVLADPPGSENYVVVRWDEGWFVDTAPVDWNEVENEAFS